MFLAKIVTPLLIGLTTLASAQADQPAVRLCEPWKSDYVGDDATGKHVIALWKFDDREDRRRFRPGAHAARSAARR